MAIEGKHGLIRKARVEDAAVVAAVHANAWHEAYRDILPVEFLAAVTPESRLAPRRAILADPEVCCLVAEDLQGRIVGFADCGRERDADKMLGEIYAIYLLEQFTGGGLGTALMSACAGQLLRAGFVGATLWVLQENCIARRFYEALGGVSQNTKSEVRGGISLNEIRYRWDLSALEVLASRSLPSVP